MNWIRTASGPTESGKKTIYILPKQNFRLPQAVCSQEVLEVGVLPVGHILQSILSMDLRARLMELFAHGVIHQIAWQTQRFTLCLLLSLEMHDCEDLEYDYQEEHTPNCEDAFKCVDLFDSVSRTLRITGVLKKGVMGCSHIAARIWS